MGGQEKSLLSGGREKSSQLYNVGWASQHVRCVEHYKFCFVVVVLWIPLYEKYVNEGSLNIVWHNVELYNKIYNSTSWALYTVRASYTLQNYIVAVVALGAIVVSSVTRNPGRCLPSPVHARYRRGPSIILKPILWASFSLTCLKIIETLLFLLWCFVFFTMFFEKQSIQQMMFIAQVLPEYFR